MKKYITTLALISALAGTFALQAGCKSTPTRESTGEYIDDSGITTRVKAALIKDDTVKSHEITVETYKGVVSLSGFVDTQAEKEQAGYLARRITGVESVKNNVQVK